MYHLHLARNLRSFVFLLVTAAILAGIGTLWWVNRTGLPESWRIAIETEIAKSGHYVKIGSLSYHPLRGVIAERLLIYSDPQHEHGISSLERVILDFDNAQLAKGKIQLKKIELSDATLTLPIKPGDPKSESLEIQHANGTFLFQSDGNIEGCNATGMISGIRITLNARLTGNPSTKKPPQNEPESDKRRELIARIVNELKQWSFDKSKPPHIRIFVEGNLSAPAQTSAKFSLEAYELGKNQHNLKELTADAEIAGSLLTVTSLKATDARGQLNGRFDFDMSHQNGRFDIQSSLDILHLLNSWLELPPLRDILIAGRQELSAVGDFSIQANTPPEIHMTGRAHCESTMLRGIRFDVVESDFAWNTGDLFLRGIRLVRPEGQATGKALIQWPLVRLALDSTLPARLYQPLFVGKPLEKVIGNFAERDGSKIHITLEGGFDSTDPYSWAYTGSGTVENVDYAGVPLHSATCNFALSHDKLDFSDGTVVFNYQNYALRKQFDGPSKGTANVGLIRYTTLDHLLLVKDVTGSVWAAPLVRLFAPKIADSVEIYQFHTPPELSGSGIVDLSPGTKEKTHLEIAFSSNTSANYQLLGANIKLQQPSGKVIIDPSNVLIQNLKTEAFGGPVTANFEFPSNKPFISDIQWTKLSMNEINEAYKLNLNCGGEITGRIHFNIKQGAIETLQGEGLFALDKTELFSVPIFGPLSPLISGVLRDKRSGFESAKSAFCTFGIRNGIVSTGDFSTSTTSLVFAGDGSVNLNNRTMDMTMRLNARGLLGLITLPFKPFYNMFQFRGTGPLNDTKWENVMFTKPNETQEKLLVDPPKAKIIPLQN